MSSTVTGQSQHEPAKEGRKLKGIFQRLTRQKQEPKMQEPQKEWRLGCTELNHFIRVSGFRMFTCCYL